MNKRVEDWRLSIKRMSIDELMGILYNHEMYDSRIIDLVRARITRMTTAVTKKEDFSNDKAQVEVRDAVIVIMHNLQCPFKIDRFRDIVFTYEGKIFSVNAGNDGPFIEIWHFNWLTLPWEAVDEVSRLKSAINDVNFGGHISTTYVYNKDTREVCVSSGVRFLFIDRIPHREQFFLYMLDSIIETEQSVTRVMSELLREEHPECKLN